ncbi:hypothetical protein BH10ACT7_BH10ACT7_08170 [soil metagenome]
MTEPQVWVLMGVFTSAIFGMLTWQTISFHRALNSLGDRFDAKLDALREVFDAKIGRLSDKIDALDRDVQALTRKVFGDDSRH